MLCNKKRNGRMNGRKNRWMTQKQYAPPTSLKKLGEVGGIKMRPKDTDAPAWKNEMQTAKARHRQRPMDGQG